MSIGVLMLHGFSGGPYEIDPLAEYIETHTKWLVEKPIFTGHGDVDHLSLKGYKAKHWMMDAEIAYRNLKRKVDEVYVVGFSMGGLIALYLSVRYGVKKIVLLSAAAKYIAPSQLLKDLKIIARDAINGQLQNNELFKRYENKIMNVPVSATIEFMKIVRHVEPYLPNIKVPTYIVQGELDGIVPFGTAQYLFDVIASEEKYLYSSPKGKHHICYSDDCHLWFQKVLKFLS